MSIFKKTANKVLKRIGVQLFTMNDMRQELYRALRNWGPRAPAYSGSQLPPSGIKEPTWNYVSLYREGTTHPIKRRIDEAIIRECLRNGGEVVERFKSKCTKCGEESMKVIKTCGCGGNTRAPDITQKAILQKFIKNPNHQDEWRDLLVSILRYMLNVDDWYIFITRSRSTIPLKPYGFAENLTSYVTQVFILDSRYIRIATDDYGLLGNEEYFCPNCYDSKKGDEHWSVDEFRKYAGQCPKCQGNLQETAYVWRDAFNSDIKARFSKTEVIHGSMDRELPHFYGTPKMIAVLRPMHITRHMNRFNLEAYASGHTTKMVIATGISQTSLNQAISDAKEQTESRVDQSSVTGQQGAPKQHTMILGIDEEKTNIHEIDAMYDPDKMQSLDWYKQHVEDICGPYGVTPRFSGVAEAGQGGVLVKIDVDNAVAELYQTGITGLMDETLWPLHLGVTDYVWHFNPVEERDQLLIARRDQLNVDTAIKAANAGLTVELEETGELKVSGIPEKREPMPFGEKPIDEKGMEIKIPGEAPSSVESPWEQKKGKTWLVKELDAEK